MRRSLVLVGWLAVAAPLGASALEPVETVEWEQSPRVRLAGLPRAALVRALRGAALRLEQPACRAVLGDFREAGGDEPGERLRALGLTASEFLNVIVFARGARQGRCAEPGVLAVTSPGSRVVYACEGRFAELATHDPETAEATLIHEALHSLGVPEDPPTSREITRRVLARCGDRARAAAVIAAAPTGPARGVADAWPELR
mgnify:CR=1 FL=1|jgi:hypothetical protein